MHNSLVDSVLNTIGEGLKTLSHVDSGTGREYPARAHQETVSDDNQRRHIAGLMRVNHAGEICAQGLYHGQALTARLNQVRDSMQQAAAEEGDHLQWCRQRLTELDDRTSLLDPLWYGASLSLGACAGMFGDTVSLGFVAEIEDQVHSHLQRHIDQLPADDQRTKAILTTMQEDEARHQHNALDAGGIEFPAPVRRLMSISSKLMTYSSYRL